MLFRSSLDGAAHAVQLASNYISVCALLSNGAVKCWGDHQFGELGSGNGASQYTTPVAVSGLTSDVTSISSARSNYSLLTCATLGTTGDVKCWGEIFVGNQSPQFTINIIYNTPTLFKW